MAPNTSDGLDDNKNQPIDYAILFGEALANPQIGDEVCITGMAGVFPNSHHIYHFRDNLMEKIDMIDDDDRRWAPMHPEIPQRTGKIYDIQKFDAGFFGIHHRQSDSMDPMARIFFEKALEAIMDAGVNPSELEGSKTGVFVGVCASESERESFFENLEPEKFALTGCLRSMISNRLSYFLKLKCPSVVTDTACSSSLYALENAYTSIRTGICDMAIVGGANVCLHPFVSLQFARLGVLSMDGSCKSFDAHGNGYCRSEAISCIFLQKAKDSRRIYARVVHAKTGCDGYKEQGITYPSGEMQKKLLQEFYVECGISPSSLSFLEAHGTGTKVGDPEEVNAIDEVFSSGRDKPLLIGAVKSNIGHSEPASGLSSVIKCIIGMEEGFIPPNINYSVPREGIKALEEERIKVVSEKMPFEDDRGILGINSFGFGGGNCHVLLKWNEKLKANVIQSTENLPKLICLSGRVPEAITQLAEDITSRKVDYEYIQLLREIFKKDIIGHCYRGFTIISDDKVKTISSKFYEGEKPSLLLAFGHFGSSWVDFTEKFSCIPIFNKTINRIQEIMKGRGVNFKEILNSETNLLMNNILGTVAFQLATVDFLKNLDIVPTNVIGYSIGEIACGYFDESLTLEQAIWIAFVMATHLKEFNRPSLSVAVQGNINQIIKLMPKEAEVIWNNSENIITISGEVNYIREFINHIQEEDIEIIAEFDVSQFTLHSKSFSKIESTLLLEIHEIITQPAQRSGNWISSSTAKVASPEYFIKALHSQIIFQDLDRRSNSNLLIAEIGNGHFSRLLEITLEKGINIINYENIPVKNKQDSKLAILKFLGSLYEFGFNPKIHEIYPKFEYPVSRGTPMISPNIKWNHSKDWHVLIYNETHSLKSGERILTFSLKEEEWQFAGGHIIDGRNLFPATGYLRIVWDTLTMIHSISDTDTPVVLENCRFKRATTLSGRLIDFDITIQRKSGQFEIAESGLDIVTGRIYIINEEQKKEFSNIHIASTEPCQSDSITLKTKDIYKELRLRGYNYKGAFRGIEECNSNATKAYIKWEGNWISFMDNMLQLKILQLDTRLLYVPTGIQRLIIDPVFHLKYIESFGENPVLPVYASRDANVIKCGGIEIRGLTASSIARRKQRGDPVLEKCEFVPNEVQLNVADSLRVNLQIGLENLSGIKVKVVEVIDEVTREESEPLGPTIFDIFGDLPLIQANISIFCKNKLDLQNVTVEDKELRTESDCHLIVGTQILQRALMMQQVFSALKEKAFILSRENPDFDPKVMDKGDLEAVDILTIHDLGTEKLVYCRKALERKDYTVIHVSETDEEFSWLPHVQSAVKNNKHIILCAQNEIHNGLLGLFNCIRREPGGTNVVCFFIFDDGLPPFEPTHPFYENQLRRNMAVNIYKNGKWGTYRHLLLNTIEEIESEHCFINPITRGDLSSLRWIEGPLNCNSVLPPEKTIVQVYYASINFRDIMTASGRINADVITMDRIDQECVQGFEFSGRDLNGRRVMGMVIHGALTTMLAADSYLLTGFPDNWTMEQAATVPVVYGTVLYALCKIGKIKKGDSVLIHSGTGGVGQAAINLALCIGCNVFTTVGTPEKRELIKQIFPQLNDKNIGNSRDISFEVMVKKYTKGRGVDLVLNSLSEDKLLASVRCLAPGGKFLEIGKFDLASNNELKLSLLKKNCSFHGIMIDQFFTAHPKMKKDMIKMLNKGLKEGYIKPLQSTVFKMNEIEQAFRHMVSGKHTGKVMIKVRDEEQNKTEIPPTLYSKGIPRFTCDPEKSCIIIGGLGGFGLELADWLILRGARKIMLTSRTGIQTGYQSYRLNVWKAYGTFCNISTEDITTKEGCENIISEAEKMGPIESIFNLAVILRDGLIDNQSSETMRISFGPKAKATQILDEITRKRCPNLRDFVVFSSVSCGRGNAGQTNYGMSNSVMERICEQRKEAGYSALAIQWGAIGDVGLVAEMMEEHTEMEIGGTLQQRITSCLQVMDVFLRQREGTIVASMLVAEKRSGAGGADNIVDAVANILGIKKQSVSPHTTLSELGMDSMTAVEIKQVLEREFEVFLTAQDIRSMTFARLQEIQESKEKDKESGKITQRVPRGFELMLRYLGDEATSNIPSLRLPSLIEDDSPEVPFVFCFPGIEGFATSLKPLVANVKARIVGIQFCYKNPTNSYKTIAIESMEQIEKYVTPTDPLNILTYSWGTIIALEAVSMLEKKGYKGTIICVDGAPDMLIEMCRQEMKTGSEAEFETVILCHFMALYLSYDIILNNREKLYKCNTFEERLQIVHKISAHDPTHSSQYQKRVAVGFHTRLKELKSYEPEYAKIISTVKLFKPSTLSVQNFAEDYNLTRLCANAVETRLFEGNHISILDNPSVPEAINEIFNLKSKTQQTVQLQETREE